MSLYKVKQLGIRSKEKVGATLRVCPKRSKE